MTAPTALGMGANVDARLLIQPGMGPQPRWTHSSFENVQQLRASVEYDGPVQLRTMPPSSALICARESVVCPMSTVCR